MFNRRQFLGYSLGITGSMFLGPRMTLASVDTDRRFVFIIQRGAADGLNTVVPYADPSYSTLRGAIAIDPAESLKLDGMFALHPALTRTAEFYGEGEALFVHAVASPYRNRSHFDGQNVLETGGTKPNQLRDGWLNRLLPLLPQSKEEAIAFAPVLPLALRGTVAVNTYSPSKLPEPTEELLMRVAAMYDRDAQLHALWAEALEVREVAVAIEEREEAANLGTMAAGFLTTESGPRIAMIETSGWDTHAGQKGRLKNQLTKLDALFGSLRDGLGDVWSKTTVLVATEFGRTAAVNGSGGTDHGTASAAMVLGGSVSGGRVVADWPGLKPAALYEGRDLTPTLDLNVLIAKATAEGLGLDPELTMRTLFPQQVFDKSLPVLVSA
ncbi:DUF1501 domain-containing protein [Pseudaminobacter sp. 19-2017]|uniref:DUF1501 domain-containing protein n=1 Tax=Pseudaminobacter soli (ex Zhang et al. 2022) TaxID=2831468 RepID=A0A942DWT5_9HYPH|nr:DUF1501 domain-containing protein [Pseudaminobacter soli]MBS3648929.1 DUF1501 domain-containing protein [Pseudaminobacter soli]